MQDDEHRYRMQIARQRVEEILTEMAEEGGDDEGNIAITAEGDGTFTVKDPEGDIKGIKSYEEALEIKEQIEEREAEKWAEEAWAKEEAKLQIDEVMPPQHLKEDIMDAKQDPGNLLLNILRGIFFIPVGILLSILLNSLYLILMVWLCNNDPRRLFYELLWGWPLAFGVLLPIGLSYLVFYLSVKIAPNRRWGAILFGIFYGLLLLLYLIGLIRDIEIHILFRIITLLCMGIGGALGFRGALAK